MVLRIQQLPPLIANQIAAGEVIERPASVVKELLENALDAGADSIAIEIGYGGLNQIKISDNGRGIVDEDLPLAIAAHATSKITTLNDLYAINSMGFRGEALASIASVAKVTISSRTKEQDNAMMIRSWGTQTQILPCARTVGTTVDVVDLFFNAPVRKRFLKSEQLEFQSIEIIVKRFALSAPEIALSLKHNGKQVLSLPAATSEQAQLMRLTRLLGKTFVQEAIHLDVKRSSMRLYGWTSGRNFQRSQNDKLWVYVNQRMVKDKLINHAIKQAYEEVLHPGRFPACVLYFTINHEEVDVNIHPTKYEVRFQQPRLVHDFFTSQLSIALHVEQEKKKETVFLKTDHSEIQEPFPQFTMTPQLECMEVSWVTLNNRYSLVFIEKQPYVVDLLVLYQHYVQEQLIQQVKPLASRPLLVPIRTTINDYLKQSIAELISNLSQLGIQLELITDYEVIVRSIPLSIPYLNLSVLFETLRSLDNLNWGNLIELISQAQVFDPRLLSSEEKMELNQFLIKNQKKHKKLSVSKALTMDACRNLLDV
jgi:DNA mismatch repair protein MutL